MSGPCSGGRRLVGLVRGGLNLAQLLAPVQRADVAPVRWPGPKLFAIGAKANAIRPVLTGTERLPTAADGLRSPERLYKRRRTASLPPGAVLRHHPSEGGS